MLKQGRRGDPTPYFFDNYKYETVFTNPETGAWFTQSGNGMFKDLKIVNVSGTVYSFETIEVGRPFEVRDMNGDLVIKDRGHLRTRFSVDTLGDSDLRTTSSSRAALSSSLTTVRIPASSSISASSATDLIG